MNALFAIGPGDIQADRRALATSDPARGIVAITVPVKSDGIARIGRDLLVAMGKDPLSMPAAARGDETLRFAALWLRANRIRELALVQAQWLTPAALRTLLGLGAEVGARVWLLANPDPSTALAAAVVESDVAVADWSTFWDAVASMEPSPPSVDGQHDVPPANDLAYLLDGEAVPPARELYEQAKTWALGEWFGDGHQRPVARFIELAVGMCRTEDERRATIIGVADGLTRRGLALEPTDESGPADRTLLTQRQWQRLDRLVSPLVVGPAVLAALHVSCDEMAALTIGDVAHDGSAVVVADGRETISVPRPARALLRAVLLSRAGHPEEAPLVVDEKGKQPSPPRLRALATSGLTAAEPSLEASDVRTVGGRYARSLSSRGLRIGPAANKVAAPLGDASVAAYRVAVRVGMGPDSAVAREAAAAPGAIEDRLRRSHAPPSPGHPWRTSPPHRSDHVSSHTDVDVSRGAFLEKLNGIDAPRDPIGAPNGGWHSSGRQRRAIRGGRTVEEACRAFLANIGSSEAA